MQEFRERLIAAALDRRVLGTHGRIGEGEQAFDYRKLPKTLRVAIDWPARWSAVRPICSGRQDEQVCRQAGIPLLLDSSIKRALDIDWNDAVEKTDAIKTFTRQLDALQAWIARQFPLKLRTPV